MAVFVMAESKRKVFREYRLEACGQLLRVDHASVRGGDRIFDGAFFVANAKLEGGDSRERYGGSEVFGVGGPDECERQLNFTQPEGVLRGYREPFLGNDSLVSDKYPIGAPEIADLQGAATNPEFNVGAGYGMMMEDQIRVGGAADPETRKNTDFSLLRAFVCILNPNLDVGRFVSLRFSLHPVHHLFLAVISAMIVFQPQMLRAEENILSADEARWSVTLELSTALSPFSKVEFFVRKRGDSGLVALVRDYAVDIRAEQNSRLVTEEELREFAAIVNECVRIDDVRFSQEEHGSTLHGTQRRLYVTRENAQGFVVGESLETCSVLVRDFVLERVELEPYRHPFWEQGEFGTLRLGANSAARVRIDGVPLEGITPISGIRLPPGTYRVEWTQLESGEVRTETVDVVAGQLTAIGVRFEAGN
jgi:hypothetical protein